MTTPTDYYLTITTPGGRYVRGQIFFVETLTSCSTELHFESSDWLASGRYLSVYVTDAEIKGGYFTVMRYESAGDLWRFTGVFESEE